VLDFLSGVASRNIPADRSQMEGIGTDSLVKRGVVPYYSRPGCGGSMNASENATNGTYDDLDAKTYEEASYMSGA